MAAHRKDGAAAPGPVTPGSDNARRQPGVKGQGTADSRDSRAVAPRSCAGCDKPFNNLRQPRTFVWVAFVKVDGTKAARVPALLCGRCRDHCAGEARPFDLPGLERAAQALEMLTLAERTGALQ